MQADDITLELERAVQVLLGEGLTREACAVLNAYEHLNGPEDTAAFLESIGREDLI